MTATGAVKSAGGEVPTLQVALGTYPHTKAFKSRTSFSTFRAEFADISPISRAFAPMVRELRFDISELALVTFLQAKAYGKPLVLLPLAIASRFQEAALLCRVDDASIAGPQDLAGKRVGVRAYSQTTGVWLRGILADDFGVVPELISWVTFEGAHVAEYSDPGWVERADAGKEMLSMLRAGELDAVIAGNDVPDDPGLRTVFRDPAASADRFWRKHGFVPVNHVLVARQSLVDKNPELVIAFVNELRASGADAGSEDRGALPFGRAALEPAVALASRYAAAQGLLPRALDLEEIWKKSTALLV